jgi:hypothetical protein
LAAIVLWYRLRRSAEELPEVAAQLIETAVQGD